MQIRRTFAFLTCCSGALPSIAAQSYPVKACSTPNEPIGVLHARGQISYRLTKAGTVDTATLRIVSVTGASPAGLRSAAVRELAGCKFDRSSDTAAVDVYVVDAVGFDSSNTFVTPATVVTALAGLERVSAAPALPKQPVEATDSRVEERPRRIKCDRVAELPPFVGSYRTRQDRDAAFAQWQRQNSGVLVARITVDVDGRVPPEGVAITSSTNPSMMNSFMSVLTSCRYVPGRIGGVAIPTIVATRTAIGNPAGP